MYRRPQKHTEHLQFQASLDTAAALSWWTADNSSVAASSTISLWPSDNLLPPSVDTNLRLHCAAMMLAVAFSTLTHNDETCRRWTDTSQPVYSADQTHPVTHAAQQHPKQVSLVKCQFVSLMSNALSTSIFHQQTSFQLTSENVETQSWVTKTAWQWIPG